MSYQLCNNLTVKVTTWILEGRRCRTILVLDFIPLKLVAAFLPLRYQDGGWQGQSWISVCHETMYQSGFRRLKPVSMSVVSWRMADVV